MCNPGNSRDIRGRAFYCKVLVATMSIITNPETNQQRASAQSRENEGLWSRLGAVYGTGKDEIRISCFFHPTYRPLRLYLDGEEAIIVPVRKVSDGTT